MGVRCRRREYKEIAMSSSSHAARVPAANVDIMMDRLGIDQDADVYAVRADLLLCIADLQHLHGG